jgi:hypothetical protein
MAMSTKTTVSRADLEAKFRSIQEGVQTKVESKRQSVLASGALGLFLLLLVFFFLGKRSGKKKSTIVEIRRL